MRGPTNSNKWIEHNKKEFGVQIIALKEIINKQVEGCGKSDEFTSDMLVALISGRKITPKMENAIDNIINGIFHFRCNLPTTLHSN